MELADEKKVFHGLQWLFHVKKTFHKKDFSPPLCFILSLVVVWTFFGGNKVRPHSNLSKITCWTLFFYLHRIWRLVFRRKALMLLAAWYSITLVDTWVAFFFRELAHCRVAFSFFPLAFIGAFAIVNVDKWWQMAKVIVININQTYSTFGGQWQWSVKKHILKLLAEVPHIVASTAFQNCFQLAFLHLHSLHKG